MVKAASLVYAVFISAIVGLLCYALMLVYGLNADLSDHFNVRKQLLLNNRSGQAYLAAHYHQLETLKPVKFFPEDHSISTSFQTQPWGVFNISSITSSVMKDSVTTHLMIANKHLENAPALYLRNADEALKISGTAYIKGDVFISGRGLKKVNIAGNNGHYNPIHIGKIYSSDKMLPKVNPIVLEYPINYQTLDLEDLKEATFHNGFDKNLVILDVTGRLVDIDLKGKIIIRSQDTLSIAPSAKLEDVIIEAPKVIFESDFEGTSQVFATHEVVLASGASLKYPSSIIISGVSSEKKSITIEEGAMMFGAIALFGQGLSSEANNSIEIHSEAVIKGDVYCDGVLSLYGSVHGSVYTSSILHETSVTKYDNLIFDGRIVRDSTSRHLFQLPLLQAFGSNEPLFVKKL